MALRLDERTVAAGEDTLAAWWRDTANGSLEARDRLILHYAPLVKYGAGRLRSVLPHSVGAPTWSRRGCSA